MGLKLLLGRGETPPHPESLFYLGALNDRPYPVPMTRAEADRLGLAGDDIVYWRGPFPTGEVWWGNVVITDGPK
jgi:hypothetical protein